MTEIQFLPKMGLKTCPENESFVDFLEVDVSLTLRAHCRQPEYAGLHHVHCQAVAIRTALRTGKDVPNVIYCLIKQLERTLSKELEHSPDSNSACEIDLDRIRLTFPF